MGSTISRGIRTFFVHVLQRNWHLFDILRAKSEARLPAILSGEEVRAILRCVRTPRNHAFLSTVYACGLRLQERAMAIVPLTLAPPSSDPARE